MNYRNKKQLELIGSIVFTVVVLTIAAVAGTFYWRECAFKTALEAPVVCFALGR